MKRLSTYIITGLISVLSIPQAFTQSCDNGGCSNLDKPYPDKTFSTTSSNWSTVSSTMNAGNYTLFDVTKGNTYDWTYCNEFGGSQGWNAELTLLTTSNSRLCYQNNSGRNACPNAPYIRWTATFTGTVKLLTSVASCLSNSGSPYSKLVWRQSATGSGSGCSGWTSIPLSKSISSSSYSGSFAVNSNPSGCSFTAESRNTSWLNVTSLSGGNVFYTAAQNSGSERTGNIRIYDANNVHQYTFTVTQAASQSGGGGGSGGGCTVSISPSSNSPSSSSGTGSIDVSTIPSGCSWTAVSNNTSWLNITSGSSGNGNGTVKYSYTTNATGSSRTGTITIESKTFTVTQSAASQGPPVTGKITGTVYNYAGITATASVFPGVKVELLTSSGSLFTSTTTNNSGGFDFPNLTGSNYQVRVTYGSGSNLLTGIISGVNTGQNLSVKLPASLHKQTSDASIKLKSQDFDFSIAYVGTVPVTRPSFDQSVTSLYLNSTFATFNTDIDKRIEALQRSFALLSTMKTVGGHESEVIQHTAEQIINGVNMILSMRDFIETFNELFEKGELNLFRWGTYQLQKQALTLKIWIVKSALQGATLLISDRDLRAKTQQILDGAYEVMESKIQAQHQKDFSIAVFKKLMEEVAVGIVTPKLYNSYFISPVQQKLNQSITNLGTLNFSGSTTNTISNLNSISANSNSSYIKAYSDMVLYDRLAEGFSTGFKLAEVYRILKASPTIAAAMEFASAILKIGAYGSAAKAVGTGLAEVRNQKVMALNACGASTERVADLNGYSMFNDNLVTDSLHFYYLKEDSSITGLINKRYSIESVLEYLKIDSAITEKVANLIQQLNMRFTAEENAAGMDSLHYYSSVAYENASLRGNLSWLLSLKTGNMAEPGIDDSLLRYATLTKANNIFTDSVLNEAGKVANNKLTPAYFIIEKIIYPKIVNTGNSIAVSVVIKLHADTLVTGNVHLSNRTNPIDSNLKIFSPKIADTISFLVKGGTTDSIVSLNINITAPSAIGASQNFLVQVQSLHNNISVAGNTTLCAGDSVMLIAHSPAGFKAKWKEDNFNMFIGVGDTIVIHSGFPGVFRALYTNDSQGSFYSDNAIEIANIPFLTPGVKISSQPAMSVCEGQNVTFTATPTNGGTNPHYTWFLNGEIKQQGTSPVFSSPPLYSSSQVYSLLTSNAYCIKPVTAVSPVTLISINPLPPAPVIPAIVSYCLNSVAAPVTAVPANGHYLLWYSSASAGTGSTIPPTPSTNVAGTVSYFVSQVNPATGCESVRTKADVIINSLPTAPAVATPVSYCLKSTATPLTATANTGHTLRWYTVSSGGTGSSSAPIPSTLNSGTISYYVSQVNSGTGCEGARSRVDVVTNPLPTINSGGDKAMCFGKSVQIGSPNISGNTYQWTPSIGLSDPLISDPVASPAFTTLYSLTVVNNFGCSVKADITLTVNPLPGVDAGPDVVISRGASVTIGAAPTATGNPPHSFLWAPNHGLNSNTVSNPRATSGHTTNYTVQAVDKNGCTNTDKVRVIVLEAGTDALVFPNPAIDEVTIYRTNIADGNYVMRVFSIAGIQVAGPKNVVVKNNSLIGKINLKNLHPGTYLLTIESNNSRKAYKIEKQ